MFKHHTNWLATITAFAMLSAPFAAAVPTLIENGGFDDGKSVPWETPGWWAGGTGTSGIDDRGRFCTTVTTLGHSDWGVQLRQNEISFIEGETYKVRFNAWASAQTQIHVGAVDETVNPMVIVFDSPQQDPVLVTTGLEESNGQPVSYEFTAAATTDKARFRFMMGAGLIPEGETLCLDDIVVEPPAKELIQNGRFDEGTASWEVPAWWAGGSGRSEVDAQGRMCTTVETVGSADWGAQLRQTGKKFIAGRTYQVSFDAWASTELTVSYDVIDEPANYAILLADRNVSISAPLAGEPQHFTGEYEVTQDSEEANFRFLYGGGNVPAGETICVDNVQLLDPEGYSVYQPAEPELAAVFANQHGYLPSLAKVATYKVVAEDFTASRTWQLVDHQGNVAMSGQTVVIGEDTNSGHIIHHIDFSNFTQTGVDFTLQVSEDNEPIVSHPFDINNELYDDLKYEALSYFYHNRSGIDILESVVGDAKWARPAGHLSDSSVRTFVCKDAPESEDCYSVDVAGGWYDAGDHGKYVVNGGISAWTLMNQYERSRFLGRNAADFAENTLALPLNETTNNLPDILDEAKFQVEWLLKMQVPEGKNFAGMAFHKMHDDGWTGLGLAPHEDPKVRYVQAPTTAATLNLAAVGAQCARVFKGLDEDLSERCLGAAETALAAALKHPQMFAGKPAADDPNPERFSMTNDNGGGMYGDEEIRDELFWAYAELYATTKDGQYKKALLDSELYGRYALPVEDDVEEIFPTALYHWGNTNMLGAMSLATVGEALNLKKSIVTDQIALLVTAADNFSDWAEQPGYAMPMDSSILEWGSNSGIMNNMMVLGVANDVTCQQDNRYVDAMANGMSYLLGHNPMGISYVTGYGENALQNPHHRFWAFQENANYPSPPPGVVSGGPNSTHLDPVSLAKVDTECPSETCFIDHIGSWSTNEITINWNSPFAWIVAYMDEQSDLGKQDNNYCTQRQNDD